jgi:N-acetylneuraminic acid mutarotase
MLAVTATTALLVVDISVATASATDSGTAPPQVSKLCSQPPSAGHMQCLSEVVQNSGTTKGRAAAPHGLNPADLLSAYNLPADGGKGATIAVVDAFDAPTAEADLAVYRAQFGLPALAPGQFRKVNQRGEEGNYPAPDVGWAGEISLDLDMVSAIAPNANILLVESDTNMSNDLGEAVDQAVRMGATEVSNSYGGIDQDPADDGGFSKHFDHPGVAMVASAGDSSYGVYSPASFPNVTSVGGTSLVKDPSTARGWSESVWHNSYGGTGSGCSRFQAKPSFQLDTGCDKRTVADVSAVADPVTGVAMYDSYGNIFSGGNWGQAGGTSASAPIIAGTYALAGRPVVDSYPNSYPYAKSDAFNDVTDGSNGKCSPAYLCTAGPGYDGPTGLGTPNGLAGVTAPSHGEIIGTVTDAATHQPISGAKVTVGKVTTYTDSKGRYDLALRVGSYDVSVTEYGYIHGSVTGVAVAQGKTVTRDFSLSSAPMTTISGTVTDGSGHGWPLYAKVDVDEGIPSGAVHTDRQTGRFTVSVSRGESHTLHVTSEMRGYLTQDAQVTVGDGPVRHNMRLKADPAPADDAAALGYSLRHTDYTQTFDGPALPDGWTASATAGPQWALSTDPVYSPPGNAPIIVGSHAALKMSSLLQKVKSSLISGPVKVENAGRQVLAFDEELVSGQATVEVSTDDGATWTEVSRNHGDIAGTAHEEVALPDAVRGQTVRFRFTYTANTDGAANGFGWRIDNVKVVTKDLRLVPGGLVAGVTTDANTGAVLNDVTVSLASNEPRTDVSGPLGTGKPLQGFYAVFAPSTGKTRLKADLYPYATTTKKITVVKDHLVDGSIALNAGRLSVKPGAVKVTADSSRTVRQDVTLANTGTAPITVAIGESSGAPDSAAPATPTRLTPATTPKDSLSRLRGLKEQAKLTKLLPGAAHSLSAAAADAAPITSGSPQGSIADVPESLQYNIADTDNGTLYTGFGLDGNSQPTKDLYAYSPATNTWSSKAPALKGTASPAHAFIGGKLYVTGGFDLNEPSLIVPVTQVYDPATNTWTRGSDSPAPTSSSGSAVLDGKLYVVSGISTDLALTSRVEVYDPATDTWSRAADYPLQVQDVSCGTISGVIYCAGGGTPIQQSKVFAYDPKTNTWTPKAGLPHALLGAAGTVADGKLLVAGGMTLTADGTQATTNQALAYDPGTNRWTPLPNLAGPRAWAAGALGFYVIGGGASEASVTSVEQIPGYDHIKPIDLPWLHEDKTLVTIEPGHRATVRVELNPGQAGTGSLPATVTGGLTFTADSPYIAPNLPITFTTEPPTTCKHRHGC